MLLLMVACDRMWLVSEDAESDSLSVDCRTGDLIFVTDTVGMGKAVNASTGQFSHVALVLRLKDKGLHVIEATPSRGVSTMPLTHWLKADSSYKVLMRPTVAFDSVYLLSNAMRLEGLPYDFYFLPDNDMYYCSELVEVLMVDLSGNRLFHAEPMNFLDSLGNMPLYWSRLFDSLGCEVPQGVMGTNPTAMSQSTMLEPLPLRSRE